jgi:hypothetical protein
VHGGDLCVHIRVRGGGGREERDECKRRSVGFMAPVMSGGLV